MTRKDFYGASAPPTTGKKIRLRRFFGKDKEVSRRMFVVGSVGAASALATLWGSWPWLPIREDHPRVTLLSRRGLI